MPDSFQDRVKSELSRLCRSQAIETQPLGVGVVRFLVTCKPAAGFVLERAKSVLVALDNETLRGPDDRSDWKDVLPHWFTAECRAPLSTEEAKAELCRWRALSPEAQEAYRNTERWSMDDWLYWFEPANRYWYWWDGAVASEHIAVVAVDVLEWPFPWGSLSWLLRASGAQEVSAERD